MNDLIDDLNNSVTEFTSALAETGEWGWLLNDLPRDLGSYAPSRFDFILETMLREHFGTVVSGWAAASSDDARFASLRHLIFTDEQFVASFGSNWQEVIEFAVIVRGALQTGWYDTYVENPEIDAAISRLADASREQGDWSDTLNRVSDLLRFAIYCAEGEVHGNFMEVLPLTYVAYALALAPMVEAGVGSKADYDICVSGLTV